MAVTNAMLRPSSVAAMPLAACARRLSDPMRSLPADGLIWVKNRNRRWTKKCGGPKKPRRSSHVQPAAIVGSHGHSTHHDHWRCVSANSYTGSEPQPSNCTSRELFRWDASQKLDSVKVGCGKKALGSKSGEIHRLPEATRRATESETAVAARPGTLPRKMHVPKVLVGLCCSCLDCTSNHLGMSADTLVFIALRRTAKSPQQSLCGSNRFLAPSNWFSMVSA